MGDAEDEIDETYGKDLPWRKVTSFISRIILRHPLILSAVVVASFGVVAAELVGIALMVTLLVGMGQGAGGATMLDGTPIGILLPVMEGMTVEQKIRFVAVGLVVVALVRGLFGYIESRVSGYMKIILERDLRQMVFDEMVGVELQFINKEKTANLFTILHTYPKQAALLADEYLGFLSKGIMFAVYGVVMFLVSWQVTLLAIALGGLSAFAVGRFKFWIKRMGRKINRSRVRLHQVSLESLQAAKVIRLFGREEHARAKFGAEVRTLQRQSYKTASLTAAMPAIRRVINAALLSLILIAATYVLTVEPEAWTALFLTFLLVTNRLAGPMGDFAKRQTRIATQMPALEAIITFMERPDKRALAEGAVEFDRLREGVRFERVSFAYGDGTQVLHDVSFAIPRGRMVALVGASGSGKSTLIHLLARLGDPTAGRVVVDGRDLRELRVRAWRRRVAVVSQDTYLFNETVRENIRYGRLEATDAEVEAAAKLANAHDFILEMENGYDTMCGDRGVRLSGGQSQRIAIARALLADPDILVLDEATSALDTATERLVQEAIERASRHRTVVAVAHRLSTIRRADEIIVLEQGRIVERGTHLDLMRRGGAYAAYVHMQDMTETPVSVPVVEAAAPLRVLLEPRAGTAQLLRGETLVRASVPLRVANGHGDMLAQTPGDVVVLRAGSEEATVRVDGALHASVPIWSADGGAAPRRVRVQRVIDRT